MGYSKKKKGGLRSKTKRISYGSPENKRYALLEQEYAKCIELSNKFEEDYRMLEATNKLLFDFSKRLKHENAELKTKLKKRNSKSRSKSLFV